MRRQSCFSSFTSAIFTQRKIFSSSFTISAARVRADRHHARNDLRVQPCGRAPARRIDAADDFGNLRQAELLVAGIFALGRKGQIEIGRRHFPRRPVRDRALQAALFENRQHEFFGRARIGGALEHDQVDCAAGAARSPCAVSVPRSSDPARGARRAAWERRSGPRPSRAAARNPTSRPKSLRRPRACGSCPPECAGCRTRPRSACRL